MTKRHRRKQKATEMKLLFCRGIQKSEFLEHPIILLFCGIHSAPYVFFTPQSYEEIRRRGIHILRSLLPFLRILRIIIERTNSPVAKITIVSSSCFCPDGKSSVSDLPVSGTSLTTTTDEPSLCGECSKTPLKSNAGMLRFSACLRS